MTLIIPERVAVRAATRFTRSGECNVSEYSVGTHGYAQIGWQGDDRNHATTAHRAAWVHFNGAQIPEGQTVDHECKNRRCVREGHLRLLPNLENARRTNGWDWSVGTCRHGHGPEFWKPKGPTRQKGYCHACRMNAQRKRRGTKKPRAT